MYLKSELQTGKNVIVEKSGKKCYTLNSMDNTFTIHAAFKNKQQTINLSLPFHYTAIQTIYFLLLKMTQR